MKIGHAYYLELEDHSHKPLIVQPFEAYHGNYGPLIYYGMNMKRIRLNKLLSDSKVKKRILLSTTQGKSAVKEFVKGWNPIGLFFRNFATAIIKPYRYEYKDRSYGKNTHYLVIFGYKSEENVLPVYDDDYQSKKYRDLGFTRKTLTSPKTLRSTLTSARRKGLIKFDTIEIIDFRKELEKHFSEGRAQELEGQSHGFFEYAIMGRLYTWRENRRLNIQNKRNRNKTALTSHNNM